MDLTELVTELATFEHPDSPLGKEPIGDFLMRHMSNGWLVRELEIMDAQNEKPTDFGQFIVALFSDAIGTGTSPMAHIVGHFLANWSDQWEFLTVEQWQLLVAMLERCNVDWSYDEMMWPFFSCAPGTSAKQYLGAFFGRNHDESGLPIELLGRLAKAGIPVLEHCQLDAVS